MEFCVLNRKSHSLNRLLAVVMMQCACGMMEVSILKSDSKLLNLIDDSGTLCSDVQKAVLNLKAQKRY